MSIAQQPDEIELERRMCPGALSQTGFLARSEHLAGVLAQDAATLAKLGVTAEQLADALDHLVAAAEHARPRRVARRRPLRDQNKDLSRLPDVPLVTRS